MFRQLQARLLKSRPDKAGVLSVHRAVEHRHQNATVTDRLPLQLPETLDLSKARHLDGPPGAVPRRQNSADPPGAEVRRGYWALTPANGRFN